MADIAVVAAKVAPVFPATMEVYDFVAGEIITAGQALYLDSTTGRVLVADANVAGKQTFLGIALNNAGAGQAVGVIKRGHLAGFTIPQAHFALAYVSDTAGAIADAAGTVSIIVGRVIPVSDASATKLLYVDALWR